MLYKKLLYICGVMILILSNPNKIELFKNKYKDDLSIYL